MSGTSTRKAYIVTLILLIYCAITVIARKRCFINIDCKHYHENKSFECATVSFVPLLPFFNSPEVLVANGFPTDLKNMGPSASNLADLTLTLPKIIRNLGNYNPVILLRAS